MKKIIATFLGAITVMSLVVGCGDATNEVKDEKTEAEVQTETVNQTIEEVNYVLNEVMTDSLVEKVTAHMEFLNPESVTREFEFADEPLSFPSPDFLPDEGRWSGENVINDDIAYVSTGAFVKSYYICGDFDEEGVKEIFLDGCNNLDYNEGNGDDDFFNNKAALEVIDKNIRSKYIIAEYEPNANGQIYYLDENGKEVVPEKISLVTATAYGYAFVDNAVPCDDQSGTEGYDNEDNSYSSDVEVAENTSESTSSTDMFGTLYDKDTVPFMVYDFSANKAIEAKEKTLTISEVKNSDGTYTYTLKGTFTVHDDSDVDKVGAGYCVSIFDEDTGLDIETDKVVFEDKVVNSQNSKISFTYTNTYPEKHNIVYGVSSWNGDTSLFDMPDGATALDEAKVLPFKFFK